MSKAAALILGVYALTALMTDTFGWIALGVCNKSDMKPFVLDGNSNIRDNIVGINNHGIVLPSRQRLAVPWIVAHIVEITLDCDAGKLLSCEWSHYRRTGRERVIPFVCVRGRRRQMHTSADTILRKSYPLQSIGHTKLLFYCVRQLVIATDVTTKAYQSASASSSQRQKTAILPQHAHYINCNP